MNNILDNNREFEHRQSGLWDEGVPVLQEACKEEDTIFSASFTTAARRNDLVLCHVTLWQPRSTRILMTVCRRPHGVGYSWVRVPLRGLGALKYNDSVAERIQQ
jgi:hypothetical protein